MVNVGSWFQRNHFNPLISFSLIIIIISSVLPKRNSFPLKLSDHYTNCKKKKKTITKIKWYLWTVLCAIELRSWAFWEPLVLLGMEKMPKARRMRTTNDIIINPPKISVEFDDLRGPTRECLPFTAIATEICNN